MIKAIDTRYKKFLFRSRLEARWAVFFDQMGFEWQYEPQGFHVDGLAYLPDFCVMTPQGKPIWYEIKPLGIDRDEKFDAFRKAIEDQHGHSRVALLAGDPVDVLNISAICPRCGFLHVGSAHRFKVSLVDVWHGEIRNGRPDLVGLKAHCEYCWPELPDGTDLRDAGGVKGCIIRYQDRAICMRKSSYLSLRRDVFEAAAQVAREARFEHGAQA